MACCTTWWADLTDEDPRERTVGSMQRRYHVDTAQAERVEATALTFLGQVAEAWELEDENAELVLKWAARLHEIGLDVAHSGYHRHGAYLLDNADLPGFAREEQLLLARLVGTHRRKPIAERHRGPDSALGPAGPIPDRPAADRGAAASRSQHHGAAADRVGARGRTLDMRFPSRWLKEHALSAEDLHQEIEHLRDVGVKLRVYSGSRTAAA